MDFSGIAAGACVRLEAAFICIFHHRGRPTLAAPTLCAGCGRRHFGSPPLFRCFSLIFLCFCFCFFFSSHYCCAMITMILMARSFLRLPPSDWLLSVAAVFELFSRFVLVERGNNWMDFPPTSHSFDRFLWKLIESNCLFFFRSRLASQFFLGSHFRAIKCFSIYGSSFEFF